jgi:hypothetical protein
VPGERLLAALKVDRNERPRHDLPPVFTLQCRKIPYHRNTLV